MMRSLLANSPDVAAGVRDRVVLVTSSTSPAAITQMRRDGLTVLPVPNVHSPYTSHAKFDDRFAEVMTKLTVFNLTTYSRIVFIDADSLVLRDLSPLFSCARFCAAFINPCYFNSGLMLLTPDRALFTDMHRVLPTTPSYDGGDQGFLNEYFPAMLDAPVFDPDHPPPVRPPFARLPFSWHVDHSAYYPTFSFAFENSNRCGRRHNIEWLGPPLCKPWLWWTYAALDLSWTWNHYRAMLPDPYPPALGTRRNAVLLILTSYLLLVTMHRLFAARRAPVARLVRLLTRLNPSVKASPRMACFYPVALGLLLWAVHFAAAVVLVPQILQPRYARVVFFHLRLVGTLAALAGTGLLVCAAQRAALLGGGSAGSARAVAAAFRRMVVLAALDAAYLLVAEQVLWARPFQTMWAKGIAVLSVLFGQAVLAAAVLARTALMWSRLAQGDAAREAR
ncbi:Glycosyl transferase, family GT8 [Chondrus crispus]|uniref:Glycosyl transferase, family GT8 n=1 Tax=Chondrus crispus TaxID=2769 RepID=R7QQH2_CHOCR|nr:Glycosyl transferase, family GT8 [Chondrus crispus]CDF40752.1 Glycosyl transferase, family GT8 [Chondrus crispus]|eukprot:XP_005711046.1 Glycosyl transferase, family GT8 [Chondrus crispus]